MEKFGPRRLRVKVKDGDVDSFDMVSDYRYGIVVQPLSRTEERVGCVPERLLMNTSANHLMISLLIIP